MTPFLLFRKWYEEELQFSQLNIPSACCLSTVGLDGFPNARFVSLKEITDTHFIITGPLSSRKGMEISNDNKVALTCWWTATERQVRIQGTASLISDQLADTYFSERNRESQIISTVSNQGKEMDDLQLLIEQYNTVEIASIGKELIRPANWGGYQIEPLRIEFLEFRNTRFHERKLYEVVDGAWVEKWLQP